jgi:PilZ domain
MAGLISNPRNPINTRRWPRFHVHLPVLIAAETADSQIGIPGMVSAISRSGMEVYGGVPLRPGDLMEVEFRTAGTVRIAGIVRNRSGYCFGMEFLRLAALDSEIVLATEFSSETPEADWTGAHLESLGGAMRGSEAVEVASADETLAALFIERHQSYLRASQKEIDRLRRGTLQFRHMREAMERLLKERASEDPTRILPGEGSLR